MDITLENIASVELPADLETALMAKLEPKVPTFLTGKGFVVKAKADYDTELTTHADTAVKKAVDEESAKLYGRVDSLVGLALGLTKPDKMRSRDWFAQLETEGKLPLSGEALAKVQAAMKGTGSETQDAVLNGLKKELEESKKENTKAQSEAFQRTVLATVTADLRTAPVLVDSSLKDAAAIATAKNVAVGELKSYFQTFYEGKQDNATGETYFVKKGTDTPLVNVAENRPMTPTEIFRAFHPMFLTPAGHQQQGGGTNKPPVNEGGTPGSFKSLGEITAYAIKTKGFAAYSPEFNKFVAEERKLAKL